MKASSVPLQHTSTAICFILNSVSAIFVWDWYDKEAYLPSFYLRNCLLPDSNEVGIADVNLIQISNACWERAFQIAGSLESDRQSAQFQSLKGDLLPVISVAEHVVRGLQ